MILAETELTSTSIGLVDILVLGFLGLMALCSLAGLYLFGRTVCQYFALRRKWKNGEFETEEELANETD